MNYQKANTRPGQAAAGPLRYTQESKNESEGECWSGVGVLEAREDKGRGLRRTVEENG